MLKILKKINDPQNKKSNYFIILANIIALLGVLFLEWNIVDIIQVFFLETIIIGFYSVLKIITVERQDFKEWPVIDYIIKFFYVFIFVIIYGTLTYVLGILIFALLKVFTEEDIGMFEISLQVWPYILALFISHGYSFYKDFWQGEERKNSAIRVLTIRPFFRLISLIGVIFTGVMVGVVINIFVSLIMGGNMLILVCVLIIIKTVMDLVIHRIEKKKSSMAQRTSNAFDSIQKFSRDQGIEAFILELLKGKK